MAKALEANSQNGDDKPWYLWDTLEQRIVDRCANWDEAADRTYDLNEKEGYNRFAPRGVDDERLDRAL